MRPVFAGTAYYLALVNPADLAHARAVDLSESLLGRTFVTEYVLVELGNCLSRSMDRPVFLEVLEKVQSDDDTVVVPASPSLFRQGVAVFASRPDKDWSLVDCISFTVMKQRRVSDALTTDHHFEQAGFEALLR